MINRISSIGMMFTISVATTTVYAQELPIPSVSTMIEDMKSTISNEGVPRVMGTAYPKFDWVKHATITQWSPEGITLNSWYTKPQADGGGGYDAIDWSWLILPWYTAFEAGDGSDRAPNTRLQVRNLALYILWNDLKWEKLSNTAAPVVHHYTYPFKDLAYETRELATDGGVYMKPVAPKFIHGWKNGSDKLFGYRIDGVQRSAFNVRAVLATIEFRLVRADQSKPDDSENANYIVNVGADYYPGANRNWTTNGGTTSAYPPGVASGRYLKATTSWRTATMLVPAFNPYTDAYKYGVNLVTQNPPTTVLPPPTTP